MPWDEAKYYTLGQLLTMLRMAENAEERADLRSAKVCWILAEIHRDRKSHPRPFNEYDFMPGWEKRPLTEEEQIAAFNKLWKVPVARERHQHTN